ncbi:MAG: hypothetical protein JWL59_4560 [Chthoniobacteraceae bacterium]|nr:hypothetical protein [Chthoniobacteraceae bacterium]
MISHLEQVEFIRRNAPAVTACAREGYRTSGRGLVRVLCNQDNENAEQATYDFLPEIGVSKLLARWYGTKAARMVSGYNPRAEAIVIFVRKSETGETLFDTHCVKT